MERALKVVAVVAGLLAAAFPTAAEATFPGKNGGIAAGNCPALPCTKFGIFLVDPGGSGWTQLTSNPYVNYDRGHAYPAADYPSSWTPDGRRFLYDRIGPSGQFEEVRIVKADGSGDEPFAAPVGARFSPDGTKLAFGRVVPLESPAEIGHSELFVSNLDGSNVTQLTRGGGAFDADWSPDGAKIAFAQRPDPRGYGKTEIYVMNSDGTGQTRLTFELDHGAWAWDPSWSPDGTKIAFTHTERGQQYEVYSMNADGSDLVNLTNNYVGPPNYTSIYDEDPAWSPDGTQIAFIRNFRLFVMNADGTGARDLAFGVPGILWQPLPGPQPGDFRNASQFCKAERSFLGNETFRQKYGGEASAHGKCVSRH